MSHRNTDWKRKYFKISNNQTIISYFNDKKIPIFSKPIQFAIYYDTESKASIDWFEKDFKANYKTFETFLQFDYISCNEIIVSYS